MMGWMSTAPAAADYLFYQYDWVRQLVGSSPKYTDQLGNRAESLKFYNQLVGLCDSLWICALCMLLRWAWYRFWHPILKQALKQSRGSAEGPEVSKTLATLEEQWWCVPMNTLLTAASWYLVFFCNDGCAPLSPQHCFSGWPEKPMNPWTRMYYNVQLGWYLHDVLYMLSAMGGQGFRDDPVMSAHHVVSILLIFFSYVYSFPDIGVLVVTLVNSSNPLLHLSRVAHILQIRPWNTILLASFALTFLIFRVVAFPVVVLPASLYLVFEHIPDVLQLFPGVYIITNGLLLVLVIMQFFWMSAIVRVVRSNHKKEQQAAINKQHEAKGTQHKEAQQPVVHVSPAKPSSSPLRNRS